MKKITLFTFLAISSLTLAGCSNGGTSNTTKNDGYTVSFNSHGGSSVSEMKNIKRIETEPVTSRDGYTFSGWYESEEYDVRISFPFIVTEDITLHAGWDEITYTVTFDSCGGSPVNEMRNITVINSEPQTTRKGYVFLGWYTSLSSETRVSFPYVVDHNQTLYAKWEQEMKYVEMMKLSTSMGTATAYMAARYLEDSLEVNVKVEDKYVVNTLTMPDGSVNGMNDNVEIYVSPRSNQVVGLIDGETINFLAVPGDKYQAKRFIRSPDYKYEFYYSNPFTEGYSISSKLCTLSTDGFDGYIIVFNIPYALFNLSREDMFGKTSIYFAMRNSDSTTITAYGESSYLGSELRNVWTHPILNENNALVNKEISTLLIGDSYTDSEFFRNLKYNFNGLDFYGRGISGSKASEWLTKYFNNIIVSKPKDIVIHIGVNDIDDGHDKVGNVTFATIKSLVENIHLQLPNSNIHWITITDNHFVELYDSDGNHPYLEAYHYVNNHMKELAGSYDYLSIIDYASVTEGQISLFLDDGLHPNSMGYDILTDLIFNELGYEHHYGELFNKAGKLVSSHGFDLSNDINGVIKTSGTFNQYAWYGSETGKTSFEFEVSLNAIKVNNGDRYPKMGLVAKSGEKMLFFYIDMNAELTGKEVGYVYHHNMNEHWGTDFDWGGSQKYPSVLDISYTDENYTKMKMVYSSGNIELYIDDVKLFDVSNPFDGEATYFGILSFNTAIKTNHISATF